MNSTCSKILLVRTNSAAVENTPHPHGVMPPFSLKYIQALLEKGHWADVRLIDGLAEGLSWGRIVSMTAGFKPDVIVVSAHSLNFSSSYWYASAIKREYSPLIVLIGQPLSGACTEGNPFDKVFPGEGELEAAALIKKLDAGVPLGELKNSCQQKGEGVILVNDPDELPFLHFTSRELRAYKSIFPLRMGKKAVYGFVLSSRGCPHNCFFCSDAIRVSYGTRVRLRKAACVVGEIEHLAGLGANVISFADDNFTSSREHVQSVCEALLRKRLKIPWIAHARVDELDGSLLRLIKLSGCILLRFGIESASDRIMSVLGKTDVPEQWPARVRETFSLLKKVGIASDAMFIIGFPGETESDVAESIQLAEEIRPDMMQVHFFTPYPDTPCVNREEGVVSFSAFESSLYHYGKPRINLSRIETARLETLRGRFYKKIFLNPAFIARHMRDYSLFYVFNPGIFSSLAGISRVLYPGKRS